MQSDLNNPLYRLFLERGNRTKSMDKWHHYFDIYHRFFNKYRGKPITVYEIGVQRGGSLQMWQEYFGPQAKIVGLDKDMGCAAHATDATPIFIGDQADPSFLRMVIDQAGPPTLVIDDGGHSSNQQIVSFETIYPSMPSNGVYLVEDTHCNFWGGQWDDRRGETFLDYAFERCMDLHDWTKHQGRFGPMSIPPNQRTDSGPSVSSFCRRTGAVSFFDSVVVFERQDRQEPWREVR